MNEPTIPSDDGRSQAVTVSDRVHVSIVYFFAIETRR
jgi:hypothetical protein